MNKIRILLLPFSIIYGWILWTRNMAYRVGFLKSESPRVKTIVVGNLSLGGTGKTPHLEYLLNLLHLQDVAVLSRGYGRKTKGTIAASLTSNVYDIGDEPLQMARNFPNTPVVVDELRVRGINKILEWTPKTSAVLLDDALQHRQLKGGFNVLLTTWDAPFFSDYYLPSGNLRDHKVRAYDADLIIVTKCPESIDSDQRLRYVNKLSKYSSNIFFDKIDYVAIKPLFEKQNSTLVLGQKVLLVTGIARPKFLVQKVESEYELISHFDYRDHYAFNEKDIERIRNFIGRFATGEIAIVTTEKDAMRLRSLTENNAHSPLPIYYWKIGVQFDQNKLLFDKMILDYVSRT